VAGRARQEDGDATGGSPSPGCTPVAGAASSRWGFWFSLFFFCFFSFFLPAEGELCWCLGLRGKEERVKSRGSGHWRTAVFSRFVVFQKKLAEGLSLLGFEFFFYLKHFILVCLNLKHSELVCLLDPKTLFTCVTDSNFGTCPFQKDHRFHTANSTNTDNAFGPNRDQ
jgi:hypothetical protein